jgi:hypothetical protein
VEIIAQIINWFFNPAVFFILTLAGFWTVIRYREKWTEPKFAAKILAGGIAALGLAFFNGAFRELAARADNLAAILLFFCVGFFVWFSFRKAVVNDRRLARGLAPVEKETSDKKVFVWPELVFIEFIAAILMCVALMVWALLQQAPLEAPADPASTPNPAKAPWYFLGLQEMLVYFDPWLAGVVFPALIILGLMAIPYLDRSPKGSGYYTFNERKFAVTGFLFGFLALWMSLLFIGTFLRGPNWNFFGPFEEWDANKVAALTSVNLSEIVWVKWLHLGLPPYTFVREIWGILLVGMYFIVLPPFLTRRVAVLYGLLRSLGPVRYGILLYLMLFMMSLPVKMVLRWLFNLKYIVNLPEYFLNI